LAGTSAQYRGTLTKLQLILLKISLEITDWLCCTIRCRSSSLGRDLYTKVPMWKWVSFRLHLHRQKTPGKVHYYFAGRSSRSSRHLVGANWNSSLERSAQRPILPCPIGYPFVAQLQTRWMQFALAFDGYRLAWFCVLRAHTSGISWSEF
jgi:hypothetical protein